MCSKTTHFVFSLQFFSEEEIEQNWFSILFRKRKQSNFGFQISSAFYFYFEWCGKSAPNWNNDTIAVKLYKTRGEQ